MTARLDGQQRRVLAALLTMQRQAWEQGVTSHALVDLGLLDDAVLMAHDAAVRQSGSGSGTLGEVDDVGVVNSGACGEAALPAVSRDPDGPWRAALDR